MVDRRFWLGRHHAHEGIQIASTDVDRASPGVGEGQLPILGLDGDMSLGFSELLTRALVGVVRQPNQDDPSGSGSSGNSSGDDLVSDLGDDIRVTVDRWSAGQLGLSDLVAAGGVVAAGFKGLGIVGLIIPGVSASVAGGLAMGLDGRQLGKWMSIGILIMYTLYTVGLIVLVELFQRLSRSFRWRVNSDDIGPRRRFR